MQVASGKNLCIVADGQILTLDYAGALAAHTGQSWFGVAVAFRMLQAAGDALSHDNLWDREDLFVVSGHRGAGVRDAIEYVTGCVSRGCFRLVGGAGETGCSRSMRFSWEVGAGQRVVAIRLRGDFVPVEFYELLDRINTPLELPDDEQRFAKLKRELAEQLWKEPLAGLFSIEFIDVNLVNHA